MLGFQSAFKLFLDVTAIYQLILLKFIRITFSRKRWNQIFRHIDRNFDNVISFEELVLFVFPQHLNAKFEENKRIQRLNKIVENKIRQHERKYSNQRQSSSRQLSSNRETTVLSTIHEFVNRYICKYIIINIFTGICAVLFSPYFICKYLFNLCTSNEDINRSGQSSINDKYMIRNAGSNAEKDLNQVAGTDSVHQILNFNAENINEKHSNMKHGNGMKYMSNSKFMTNSIDSSMDKIAESSAYKGKDGIHSPLSLNASVTFDTASFQTRNLYNLADPSMYSDKSLGNSDLDGSNKRYNSMVIEQFNDDLFSNKTPDYLVDKSVKSGVDSYLENNMDSDKSFDKVIEHKVDNSVNRDNKNNLFSNGLADESVVDTCDDSMTNSNIKFNPLTLVKRGSLSLLNEINKSASNLLKSKNSSYSNLSKNIIDIHTEELVDKQLSRLSSQASKRDKDLATEINESKQQINLGENNSDTVRSFHMNDSLVNAENPTENS